LHPGWGYRLWTDEDNERFVNEYYPELAELYHSFTYAIQRVDVIRFLILYALGGVYADLDIECLQPIDSVLDGTHFVASYEHAQHAKWLNEPFLVSNAFMASPKHHPFLEAVITRLRKTNPRAGNAQDVLESTGPIMLTNVYKSYAGNDVLLLDEKMVSPFQSTSKKLQILFDGGPKAARIKAACVKKGTIAIHYWRNSWVKSLGGVLDNPCPYEKKNYVFYPGIDSPGHDICNEGRNIADVARRCDAMPRAAGFNTHGFIKYVVYPRFACIPIHEAAENEGIYVKKGWKARIRNYLLSIRHYSLPKLKRFF